MDYVGLVTPQRIDITNIFVLDKRSMQPENYMLNKQCVIAARR